jgi:pilus assembly protein FimV
MAERKPARARSAAAPSVAAAPVPAAGGEENRVRSGDTLSRIAGRVQQPGVSLDQMLVALFRANEHAFAGGNMNRLKSGAVLSVPTAESATAIGTKEAREVIQAQSADFGAYRQRLAAGVPDAKAEGSARQAAGKVEATVQDRKQAAATTPDKLTLSKGAVSGKAPVPEEKVSKDREKKDADTRVAELAKNVEELKRLAGAASAPAAKAPAPAPSPATPVATVTAPIAPPTPPAVTPAPAAPPVATAASASTPAIVAQSGSPAASSPEADSVGAAASAVAARPMAKAPVAQPSATPVEEPSALGAMFDDNPWALGLAAALVAMLAGFGFYRFSRRAKKDNGETSFLESRLQPDSFFGASGGQRIDTRDAGAASSSMSYSLSQLDAIGDVDPVAEADVYLAYGRDLQAEEILKEAMRSNPDRLAIRTKLLEVYAKRRDIKGFELLATQLFSLTQGAGEDWEKVQELGGQIDPDNPLYKPGGAPPAHKREGAPAKEPLGATTMPQSVLPTSAAYERGNAVPNSHGHQEAVDSRSLDLDLDLGSDEPAAAANASSREAAEPRAAHGEPNGQLHFDAVPGVPPAPASAPSSDFAMDFDLSSISLDLDGPGNGQAATPSLASEPDADLSGIDLGSDDDGADPLARKLELAEEFRQIGDMEGARDLLQEVVGKANGALKSKAQGMLDGLS